MSFPDAKTVALLNSRKPRNATPASRWVRLTRALAADAARSGMKLIAALGPLHHDLALRAAFDAGGTVVAVRDVRVLADRVFFERYAEATIQPRFSCFTVDSVASGRRVDFAVSDAADLAIVVESRSNGVAEAVALERLRDRRGLLVCPPDGSPGTQGNVRLLSAGARPLDLDNLGMVDCRPPATVRRVIEFPALPTGEWDFVVHWTRSSGSERPGESRWSFVGQLASSEDPGFRGALDNLQSILVERRIRASRSLIRGGLPVVCFTDLPPRDVVALARWARHRVRWRFEPYGVGLRRVAALRCRLRPAIYAPSTAFEALPESQRFRFQRHEPPSVDWSTEREWRHEGDVDLSGWPVDDAVVVVPCEQEANALRRVTGFRVESFERAAAGVFPGS